MRRSLLDQRGIPESKYKRFLIRLQLTKNMVVFSGNSTREKVDMDGFLPVNKNDLKERGIGQLDFVLVTGDAYVDHPSFAHAVISRWLTAHGYSVGIIAQPNWKDTEAFRALGRPKLAFLVSAGNMDSMVNLYTSAKKRRGRDMYAPGGKTGKRPARTTQVYTKKIRTTLPGSPYH